MSDDLARGRRGSFLAVLLIAVSALVLGLVPAVASAAIYTVNSIGDQADAAPGVDGCKTAVANCTLRAAIEESNASAGEDDTIIFSALFNGETLGTITIGAGFPVITDSVSIVGDASAPASGRCATSAGVEGPCVGISGEPGLDVQANGVTIRGLSIAGAVTGIAVDGDAFVARDNWLGVRLDGTDGGNDVGIFVGPGSDDAVVGGVEAADRNVIANNANEGLDIEGASGATILGNYFGVSPDGATAAGNAVNIEVSDSTAGAGFPAVGTEIGRAVGQEAEETWACDAGCNVIADADFDGVSLAGSGPDESPASGPTGIFGNRIGLPADTSIVGAENGGRGIWVGEAREVRIGGNFHTGAGNTIMGGTIGIASVDAVGLRIEENTIGDLTGANPQLSPVAAGVWVDAEGLSGSDPGARVDGNELMMGGGGDAIVVVGHGARVSGNLVRGGRRGVWTTSDNGGVGSRIYGNAIAYTDGEGVLIENDFNTVRLTQVTGAGAAGIRIQAYLEDPATGNVIGGDEEQLENWLTENEGPAVEIVNEVASNAPSQNEVAANWGEGNAGPFIDLGGGGEGNPGFKVNGGIQPPTIAASTESKISGKAEPGALVRVFFKASTEPGELEYPAGLAVAGADGNWELDFEERVPALTVMAATQTNVDGGTSELAISQIAGASYPCPPSASGCSLPQPRPTTQPKVTIKQAPKAKSTSTTAKFRFVSTEANSTFKCKLDKKAFANCKSPKTYKKLKPGKHVFKVKATDTAGNVSAVVARKFTVLE